VVVVVIVVSSCSCSCSCSSSSGGGDSSSGGGGGSSSSFNVACIMLHYELSQNYVKFVTFTKYFRTIKNLISSPPPPPSGAKILVRPYPVHHLWRYNSSGVPPPPISNLLRVRLP